MKTQLYILLFILLLSQYMFSQAPDTAWVKTYGGSGSDVATAICPTTDDGYIVAGTTSSNDGDVFGNHGGEDIWILKLNSDGDTLWTKCYGGSGSDKANSIHQTTDGGFIVAGSSASTDGDVFGNHGGGDFWILKLDASGDTIWTRCFGGSGDERANSILQTEDGSYIVAGYTESNDCDVFGQHGLSDYWILKLHSNGDTVWAKTLGGSHYDKAQSVLQTLEGDYIIAGNSSSYDGDVFGVIDNDDSPGHDGDFWVVKIDETADTLWTEALGQIYNDYATSIIQTIDGDLVITGYEDNWWIPGYMVRTEKLSNNGNPIWVKSLSRGVGIDYEYDRAYSIDNINEQAYIISGSTNWEDYNYDEKNCLVLKLDSDGETLWIKKIGGSGEDIAMSIKTTSEGYIIAGSSSSSDGDIVKNQGSDDFLVIKLNGDITVSDTIFETAYPSGYKTFFLSCGVNWSISEEDSWINVSPASGFGSDTITIFFDKNEADTSRTGIITVLSPHADTVTITLTQTHTNFFTPVWLGNPYQPMALLINTANANNLDLQEGDEIGIFDTDGSGNMFCVGSAKLESTPSMINPLLIKASADDPTTEELDGFVTGNEIYFQVFDSTSQLFYPNVNAAFNTSFDMVFNSLGTAIVELTGYGHYKPAWAGNPYQAMNLEVIAANINGTDLSFGDEIGVFYINGSTDTICVGSGIVRETISETNSIIIHLSEDNPSTTEIDGFVAGNELYFQIWDTINEVNFSHVNAKFDTALDTIFTSSGSGSVELTAFEHFKPVWAGSVYHPMTIKIIAANLLGNNFQQRDEIGIFDMVADSMVCVGAGILHNSITTGDTLVVFVAEDDPATTVIDGYTPGNDIYFQIWDSTNQVLYTSISSEYDITKDTLFTSSGEAIVGLTAYNHFKPVWAGIPYQSMDIEVTSAEINAEKMKVGDEIGIFDKDGADFICVGAGILSDSITPGNPISLIVSKDDPLTSKIDGFTSGNDMYFHLWDTIKQSEYEFVTITYDTLLDTIFSSHGEASVELGGFSHYQNVWSGNPYQPMNIIVTSAILDGQDLAVGDEIAVFDTTSTGTEICVGYGMVTYLITATNPLIILASANDPGSTEEDGFIPGNNIIYKFWNHKTQEEYSTIETIYTPGFDDVYTAFGTGIVELNGVHIINQTIELTAGWNIESFVAQADNNQIQFIHQALIDAGSLIKVIDEKGGFMQEIPGIGWLNTIDTISPTEGYYIKVSEHADLDFSGTYINTPITIPFLSGWNIMGYPLIEPQEAMDAFQPLIDSDELIKVIDEAGGFIQEIPGIGWLQTIDSLRTDEGYYIKVSSNTSLTLDYISAKSLLINDLLVLPEITDQPYKNNPYLPMNIIFRYNADNNSYFAGDKFIIYDGDICVGEGVIQEFNNELLASIVVTKDDPTTPIVDGFIVGHDISIVYKGNNKNLSFSVNPIKLFGNKKFGPFETYVFTLPGSKLDNSNVDEDQLKVLCYPKLKR